MAGLKSMMRSAVSTVKMPSALCWKMAASRLCSLTRDCDFKAERKPAARCAINSCREPSLSPGYSKHELEPAGRRQCSIPNMPAWSLKKREHRSNAGSSAASFVSLSSSQIPSCFTRRDGSISVTRGHLEPGCLPCCTYDNRSFAAGSLRRYKVYSVLLCGSNASFDTTKTPASPHSSRMALPMRMVVWSCKSSDCCTWDKDKVDHPWYPQGAPVHYTLVEPSDELTCTPWYPRGAPVHYTLVEPSDVLICSGTREGCQVVFTTCQ